LHLVPFRIWFNKQVGASNNLDSQSVILDLALILVLILVNSFFAAAEIAIVSVRKSRLRQLAEEGNKQAESVLRLSEEPSRFLATTQVGITLAGFFASAIGALTAVALVSGLLKQVPISFINAASQTISFILITTIIAFATLVIGELVPKNIGLLHAETLSLSIGRFIIWTSWLLTPAVWVLTVSTNAVLALLRVPTKVKVPSITAEEIRAMVEAGEEEGVFEEGEADMIQGVFDFGEGRAREVMIPRVDIKAIEKTDSVAEALEMFLKFGHSRLPVYDDSLDNVIGILYAKDLLRFFATGQKETALVSLMRKATFVPESKRLDELFQELQRSRRHIAIVVDEYGGTAGLVTLEDLLEEIVGEIQDEYDVEEVQVEVLTPNEIVASGRAPLSDISEVLSLNFEEEDVETVGGLVYSRLGRMPTVGDKIHTPELDIEVLAVQGRRIKQVRLLKNEEKPDDQQFRD
jgi:putative hemolysin